jgi:hypothetical protein
MSLVTSQAPTATFEDGIGTHCTKRHRVSFGGMAFVSCVWNYFIEAQPWLTNHPKSKHN